MANRYQEIQAYAEEAFANARAQEVVIDLRFRDAGVIRMADQERGGNIPNRGRGEYGRQRHTRPRQPGDPDGWLIG